MSSDEEYLDSLLKSIMGNEEESEQPSEENTEPGEEESAQYQEDALTEGEEDFLSEPMETEAPKEAETKEQTLEEETETEASFSLDDFAIQDFGEEEPSEEDADPVEDAALTDRGEDLEEATEEDTSGVMSPEDLEAMFAAADEAATDMEESKEPFEEEEAPDDDLAEISGLLKQSEDGSMTDDDMLALLESMSMDEGSEPEAEKVSAPEESDAEGAEPAVNTEETTDTDGEEKEKKKLFSGLFGRKKKKKEKEKKQETAEPLDEEAIELIDPDEIQDFDLPEAPKKGFFSRILSFLTEADEEAAQESDEVQGMEPSEENKNILEELDEEDKKKKKKKVKGKKGKKEEAEETDEGGEGDEAADTSEKKRKKKKEKKPEPPEEAVTEKEKKPGKKVSPRNIGVIAGMCLTLSAVIIVFSSIVPAFFDRRNAREAYYKADYSKAYELLYGRKLDNSDAIIFNKSKIILQMNRKLDSYHNYVSLGKEVEALDALISGVERYPFIYAEAEEYHVTEDVNAIYQTILTLLADRFGISEADAQEIIAYDDLVYTLRLESVVNGTPFVMPENAASAAPAQDSGNTDIRVDILPEEQELVEELPEESGEAPEPSNPSDEGQDSIMQELPSESPVTDAGDVQDAQVPAVDTETQQNRDGAVPEEQEEQTGADAQGEAGEVPGGSTGSQGELIQGVRQPLEINIHQ